MPRFLLVLTLVVPLAAQNTLLDRQMALGDRMARDFRKHTKPLEGEAEQYVRRLSRQLAPPDAHWEIELVKDDFGGATREPLVVPGYLFVPARLLIMTGSEAELAGMLAHAMAHLLEPPQPIALYGAVDDLFPIGEIPAQRVRELAADRRAVELAAAAGYDPRALGEYLRRVQPPVSPRTSRLPELAARVAAIDDTASTQPAREWKETTSAFASAQEFARVRAVLTQHRKPSLYRPH